MTTAGQEILKLLVAHVVGPRDEKATSPRFRVSYYAFEGPTALDHVVRGYGFSPDQGIFLTPYVIKNEVLQHLVELLRMAPRPSPSLAPFDIYNLRVASRDGKILWQRDLWADLREESWLQALPFREPWKLKRHFLGAAGSFRGPNYTGPLEPDTLLRRVSEDPNWTLTYTGDARSARQPLPFDSYAFFGIPSRAEAARYTKDPLSSRILQRSSAPADLVLLVVSAVHGAYHGTILIRELKLLVLDIENVHDRPLKISALLERSAPSRGLLDLYTPAAHRSRLVQQRASRRTFPLEVLRPGEHLFVPLTLQLGYASDATTNPDLCIVRRSLPRPGWDATQGETIDLEVLTGVDSRHNAVTARRSIDKRTILNKADFERVIVPDYHIGSAVAIDEIAFEEGGEERRLKLRPFDPNSVILGGGFEKGSCPVLYVREGVGWRRFGPVLVDAVTRSRESSERVKLSRGTREVVLKEEEAEITFLRRLELRIRYERGDEAVVRPHSMAGKVEREGEYFVLRRGESLRVAFEEPSFHGLEAETELLVEGFYVPDILLKQEVRRSGRGAGSPRDAGASVAPGRP